MRYHQAPRCLSSFVRRSGSTQFAAPLCNGNAGQTCPSRHITLSSRKFHQTSNLYDMKAIPSKIPQPTVLPPPTEEQKVILKQFRSSKCNLIVDACAGAGKTTLILRLAQEHPELRFLVLSYNNRLTAETRERAALLGLKNTKVSTIHAIGYKYYSRECSTDAGLKRVVQDGVLPIGGDGLEGIDVVIMDEQQDMTPIMKQFIDKLCSDMHWRRNGRQCRVVALGDPRQEIYNFNDSDHRFLTLADKPEVFGYLNGYPWKRALMSHSNRITPKMAKFVNHFVLNSRKSGTAISSAAHSGMTDEPPRYLVCNPFEPTKIREAIQNLHDNGLPYSEILLLAPSMRASTPARKLANDLAQDRVPIHVPDSDLDIDPSCAKGKLICCTFHQAKGLQRKAVFVFHFDHSYNMYYDRRPDTREHASNALYVATTRATQHLSLVHNEVHPPLQFVKMEDLKQFERNKDLVCEINEYKWEESKPGTGSSLRTVTDLLRNLSDECLSACLQHLDLTQIEPPAPFSDPPRMVYDVYNLNEGVAEITGTAVVSIYEERIRKTCSLVENAERLRNPPPIHDSPPPSFLDSMMRKKLAKYHRRKMEDICSKFENDGSISLPEHLYLAAIHTAHMSGLINKLVAIPNDGYTWLSHADADHIFNIIDRRVPRDEKAIFEYPFQQAFSEIAMGILEGAPQYVLELRGAPDILLPGLKQIFEVKYTATFAPKDVLQAALYAAMADRKHRASFTTHLLSAKTGQLVKVEPKTKSAYKDILQNLIDAKEGVPLRLHGGRQKLKQLNDKEFLAECKSGFKQRVLPVMVPEWLSTLPVEVETGIKSLTGSRARLAHRGREGDEREQPRTSGVKAQKKGKQKKLEVR